MNEKATCGMATPLRAGRSPHLAILVCFVLFLSGRVVAGNTGFGDIVRGQSVFQAKGCVRCHAVRGAGGRVGPDLGRKAVGGSFFEIAADMWNHSPAMGARMLEFHVTRPAFEENELADLTAFLYFLKYFDEPGNPRVGKTLFTEKHCIRCHTVGSQGGDTAPRLDSLPRTISPLRIVQDLWNHGPAMVTTMQMQGLEAPTFQGSEIIDLLAYLRSQGQRESAREFQSAGDPDRGRHFFAEKGCNRCHAIFGNGPRVGPDLGSAELRGSATQIAGRMWNHWPAMEEAMQSIGMSRPEFQKEELADLFAYIFIVRYEGRAGDLNQGEEVYRAKGCADCHRPEGKGGIGPPLSEIAADGTTKESITSRMWNHVPHMWEKMREGRIPWPRFTAEELADLLAFLATSGN